MAARRTVGLSNKLYPSVLAIIVGAFVVLAVDHESGLAILLTALASLGFGYPMPADAQTKA